MMPWPVSYALVRVPSPEKSLIDTKTRRRDNGISDLSPATLARATTYYGTLRHPHPEQKPDLVLVNVPLSFPSPFHPPPPRLRKNKQCNALHFVYRDVIYTKKMLKGEKSSRTGKGKGGGGREVGGDTSITASPSSVQTNNKNVIKYFVAIDISDEGALALPPPLRLTPRAPRPPSPIQREHVHRPPKHHHFGRLPYFRRFCLQARERAACVPSLSTKHQHRRRHRHHLQRQQSPTYTVERVIETRRFSTASFLCMLRAGMHACIHRCQGKTNVGTFTVTPQVLLEVAQARTW